MMFSILKKIFFVMAAWQSSTLVACLPQQERSGIFDSSEVQQDGGHATADSSSQNGFLLYAYCIAVCRADQTNFHDCLAGCQEKRQDVPEASGLNSASMSTPELVCKTGERVAVSWGKDYLLYLNETKADPLPKISDNLTKVWSKNNDEIDEKLLIKWTEKEVETYLREWKAGLRCEDPQSLLFVVQLRRIKSSVNTTLLTYKLTAGDRMTFTDLLPSTDYQVLLTPVGPCGHLKNLASSIMSTNAVDFTPENPSSIASTPEYNKSSGSYETKITWVPATDRTCFYELLAWESENVDYDQIESEASKDLFGVTLSSLRYATSYKVMIRGRNRERQKESSGSWLTFHTPTCLTTHKTLDVCEPPPPTNLVAYAELSGASLLKEDDTNSVYDITVAWDSSLYQPDYYIINITSEGTDGIKRNVSGDITSVTLYEQELKLESQHYRVSLMAVSSGGVGEKVTYLYFKSKPLGLQVSSVIVWSVLAPITMLIVLATSGSYIYHRLKKQKLYKKRCQYFEELEQNAPKEAENGSSFTIHPEDDAFEIIPEKLRLFEVLGEGAFGVVRKGRLMDRTTNVAVKMLKDEPSVEEVKQFRQEIDMMKSVGCHAHIVSLVGCCTRPDNIMMLVVEFCAWGDLQNYLRSTWERLSSKTKKHLSASDLSQFHSNEDKPNGEIKYAEMVSIDTNGSEVIQPITIKKSNLIVNQLYDLKESTDNNNDQSLDITAVDLLSFARQIAMGMEFLSSNRVVHRDLAARNVLVCSDKTVKIADFGLSRDVYQENMYRKTGTGKLPIKWMALESLTHQVYTTQSDVWSFGILLWEIVTLGGNPYPSLPTSRLLKLLMSGYRMECPNNCCHELYSVMLACWHARPKERPSFTDLRLQLDALLEGAARNVYLSLDLLDCLDIKDTRRIASDQPSKTPSLTSQTSVDPTSNAERYMCPISRKASILPQVAMPNHYSTQPVPGYGAGKTIEVMT